MSALKATVDRNNNSHYWQDFGSSESHSKIQLTTMSTPIVDRMSVALKAMVVNSDS